MTLQEKIAEEALVHGWEHVLSAVSGVLKDQGLHRIADHVDAAREQAELEFADAGGP